jgi:hypothetical protein
MKLNEHVRPQGIGKSQVAFQTKGRPSKLNLYADQTHNEIVNQVTAGKSSAVAIARAIANSSSTSLKQDVQNVCFEMTGVGGAFMSTGASGVDINWIRNNRYVNSGLYDYNSLTRYISVKKAGWYFVKCFLFAPAVNAAHEWGIKLISNVQMDGTNYEAYPMWMDYQHTAKHPYVNGTAIFNAPATIPQNKYDFPAFKIRLYGSTDNVTIDGSTARANLQVIRLSDLEHSSRLILSQV